MYNDEFTLEDTDVDTETETKKLFRMWEMGPAPIHHQDCDWEHRILLASIVILLEQLSVSAPVSVGLNILLAQRINLKKDNKNYLSYLPYKLE